MNKGSFWINVFFTWLVFVGIDFLFHGAILQQFWADDSPGIKSLDELATLIPYGYASFFLLITLINYTFIRTFTEPTAIRKVLTFGLIWAILFALSNLLGLYSFAAISLEKLVLFNMVYFIEIVFTVYFLYQFRFGKKLRTMRWLSIGVFFILIILTVVLQNTVGLNNG